MNFIVSVIFLFLAVNPLAAVNKAYVPNNGLNTVTILDVTNGVVLGTPTVGSNPFFAAVSADSTKIFVSNAGSNTVTVIDATTDLVTATIPLTGTTPQMIVVDGTNAFVANVGDDTISVIDTTTNSETFLITNITIAPGVMSQPKFLTIDGSNLYIGSENTAQVTVIDKTTFLFVSSPAPVFGATSCSYLSPALGIQVLTNPSDGSGRTTTIDAGTFATSPIFFPSAGPYATVFPDNSTAYEPRPTSNDVQIVDVTSFPAAAGAAIPVGTDPQFVVFKSDSSTAYVSDQGSSDVSQIDTTLLTVTPIPVSASPNFLGITADDAKVVVSHTLTDFLSIIDTTTLIATPFALAPGSSPSFVTILSVAVAVPVVTGVSPTSGSTAGGTVVAISGSGFTGATAVSFGGTPAASFAVFSDGSINATSPAHAAGTVDITVTGPAVLRPSLQPINLPISRRQL